MIGIDSGLTICHTFISREGSADSLHKQDCKGKADLQTNCVWNYRFYRLCTCLIAFGLIISLDSSVRIVVYKGFREEWHSLVVVIY